jgi:hypothetical protein
VKPKTVSDRFVTRPIRLAMLMLLWLPVVCAGAQKHWQTGTWVDIGVKRQIVDFGPGTSGFGPPNRTGVMQAMADVRTYVIETAVQRIELQDTVPIGRRSLEITIGASVTFALEKNTAYVRDAGGVEHRLRVTKKSKKGE